MINVRSIMSKNVITISSSSSISEAASLMASKSVSCLVVVEKNAPIAVIGENDVIKGIVGKKSKVSEVMGKDFRVISPSAKFSEITKTLKEGKIKKFPVVENGSLTGLITETDIVEATRDFTRFHQIVQDAILGIFGLATAFFLFYFSPLRAAILGY